MATRILTVDIDGALHHQAARVALERGSMTWRAIITEALTAWVAANKALLRDADAPDASAGKP